INGFLLNGLGSQGALCGTAGATFTFSDCGVRSYAYLQDATAGLSVNWLRSSLYFFTAPQAGAAAGVSTFSGCYLFNNAQSTGAGIPVVFPAGTSMANSTVVNCLVSPAAGTYTAAYRANLFQNGSLTVSNSSASSLAVVDNVFFDAYLSVASTTASGSVTVFCHNNLQMGYNASASGFLFQTDSSSALVCFAQNCVAMGNTSNFQTGTITSGAVSFQNCSSLNATNGFNAGGYGAGLKLNYCLDAGSTAATLHSPTLLGFNASARVVSNAAGFENVALLPGDISYFAGPTTQNDGGYDWALWYLNLGATVTVNGLVFSTAPHPALGGLATTNQESGIFSAGLAGMAASYCSFSGLGPYGVNAWQNSSIQYCYFNTNGSGIKTSTLGVTINNNVGWNCDGPFIANFGAGTSVTHNSAWGCAYGEYDALWSTETVNASNIYAGSGVYDYSGNLFLTFCDVGTLDTNTAGLLDVHSIRTNPLFQDITRGNLLLQSVQDGFEFDSPAKGAGSDGDDLGAFSMTYGVLSESWTTLTLTYNPDQLDRVQAVIKLAEGDTDGGNLYSVGKAYQTEYHFIWNENNPMPSAQLSGLAAVYNSGDGECQLSFDGAATWTPVRVVRSNDFEWQDLDMMYNDDQKPTPVREIHFRVSA
ncbi:MAG TPA: hypothetical protein VNZ54_04400, partial [bacterium]|nr:hypothetical protein [bacterium]